MSYCVARETGYPCYSQNRSKPTYVRPINCDPCEAPVRDPPKPPREILEPTCPPESSNGDWELQYCKWSGWTWVKKSEVINAKQCSCSNPLPEPLINIDSSPPREEYRKKKNGGCFSCFKKSKPEPLPPRPTANASAQAIPPKQSKPKIPKEDLERCCCCCAMEVECCCCNQVCCPCMNQTCCCCCVEEPEKRRDSKTIETQTHKEVKEKATKMSEVCIPKRVCIKRRRCCCRRPVCCCCVRNSCCPCVQNVCCACQNNDNNNNNNNNNNTNGSGNDRRRSSDRSKRVSTADQLINFCLQSSLNKPKPDLYTFKSTGFPTNYNTLQKSLGLLLKNNINIMNLFTDRRDQREFKPMSCLTSNHTISCLSSENVKKASDPEHSNLLTAVCDAILSSHKFDNDKLNPHTNALHIVNSKSTHKSFCESKSSKDSLNHATRGILEKILNELHFPISNKSNEQLGIAREIGVQVGTNQPKRSFTKLIRTKSRILTAPRFPKRVEALKRNTDLGKNGRGAKRSGSKRPKTEFSLTDLLKTSENDAGVIKWKKCDCKSKQSNIDKLLNALDLTSFGLNADNEETSQNVNLLEQTSPPFTDLDLLLSERKLELDENGGGKSPSR